MDYTDLCILIRKKNFLIKDVANQIGFTPVGLKKAITNATMPEKGIRAMCGILGITPNEFMEWEEPATNGNGNYAAHITGGNTQNSNEAITAMKDQLKEKDKQIDRLLRIIEKNKLTK